MLTEMVEYGYKIEKKVKAMKSEIKENVQETNSDGKDKQEFRKNEKSLRNLQDNFKHSNIQIIGVSEGEEEEQEIENLFEKNNEGELT